MRALAVLLVLGACGKRPPRAAPVVVPSLVYAVERNGKQSFLMGTCHRPRALEDWVDPALIDEAREVWVEPLPEELPTLERLRWVWEPRSNAADLGRRGFTSLARRVASVHSAPVLDRLAPWFVVSSMGTAMVMERASDAALNDGAPEGPSLDARVVERATRAGVPVHQVESVEEQFSAYRADGGDLRTVVDPDPVVRARLVAEATAASEVCAVNDLARVPPELVEAPEFEHRLAERNKVWLSRLAPGFQQGGLFVAVGALHLAGRQGLLELLERQGYTVTNLARPSKPGPAPVLQAWTAPEPVLMPLHARKTFATVLAEAACREDKGVRACFFDDEQACRDRVHHDAALCLDAHFGGALHAVEGIKQPSFTRCVLAGVVTDAVVNGWPERASCEAIRSAFEPAWAVDHAGGVPAR